MMMMMMSLFIHAVLSGSSLSFFTKSLAIAECLESLDMTLWMNKMTFYLIKMSADNILMYLMYLSYFPH